MLSTNDTYKTLIISNYFKFKEKIFTRSALSKVFIGHLGRNRVYNSVKERFYWIGIDKTVGRWCK